MIEIRNLTKAFGDHVVLDGIDITIEEGDIFGLIGVSGAGKSTLLRCINRLEDFGEGSLIVDGTEVRSLRKQELRNLRRNIGMVFQQFSLMERKTVYENVYFPLQMPRRQEGRRRQQDQGNARTRGALRQTRCLSP